MGERFMKKDETPMFFVPYLKKFPFIKLHQASIVILDLIAK